MNTKGGPVPNGGLPPRPAGSMCLGRHEVQLGRTVLSVETCPAHNIPYTEPRPEVATTPVCIRVAFRRVISLRQRDVLTMSTLPRLQLHPTHDWFDALDPASFTFAQVTTLGNRWPNCDNPDCRNYCLLRSTMACPDAGKPCHHL
jgi:hypothetical protein